MKEYLLKRYLNFPLSTIGMADEEMFYKKLIKDILKSKADIEKASTLRRELCRQFGPKVFPSFIQIMAHATNEEYEKL